MAIPVVDLADFGLHNGETPTLATVERVANELDKALSSVGFVYLKNHGISQHLVDEFFRASKQFFELPLDTKSRYIGGDKTVKTEGKYNNSYVRQGQEILESNNRHEIREAYDVTSLDGFFPDEDAPEFRRSVAAIIPPLCQLTHRLLKCFAIALGLNEDYFTSCHMTMCEGSEKNGTTFRSLYYPSINDSEVQAGVERCGKHSDYGTVTLLFQDDMGGLEVLSAGEWIPADPIPGTILINVGDLMQFWTGDRYLATVHRVRVPEAEIRRKSPRHSLAFFVHPDNEVMVAPLDGSSKHPPISALAHLQQRYAQTYKY